MMGAGYPAARFPVDWLGSLGGRLTQKSGLITDPYADVLQTPKFVERFNRFLAGSIGDTRDVPSYAPFAIH